MSDSSSERRHNQHADQSIDPKKLGEMNAHDRVIAAYKIAASRCAARTPSAAFRSQTIRDAYALNRTPEYLKTPQFKRKEQLIAEKQDKARASCNLESHTLKEYIELARGEGDRHAQTVRMMPSPWSQDKTPRGEYMYNWRSLPEAHRSSRQPQTPGPGAYTSDLFFIGF